MWSNQNHHPRFLIPEKPFTLLIVGSDTHTNSTRGLCPPKFTTTDGRIIEASKIQKKELWKPWKRHWKDVGHFRAQYPNCESCFFVFNGDGPDRSFHDHEGYELLTPHRQEIANLTQEVLTPAKPHVDMALINRGTVAHEGGTGELSEMLAQQLLLSGWPILPCKEDNSATHYWPELVIRGLRFRFGHHPISTSRRIHLRGAGARRQAYELTGQHERMLTDPEKTPNVAIFSHVHYPAHNTNYPVHVYYTPSWQLHTSYAHRIGVSGSQEPVGCWWFLISENHYQADMWSYLPKFANESESYDTATLDLDSAISNFKRKKHLTD